jgi:translation initiation factor IF-2
MTTPPAEPQQPAEDAPTASVPAQPEQPAAAPPPPPGAAAREPGPAAAPPPYAPQYSRPYAAPYAPASAGPPFVPVARAPRTPWVNPYRRNHVIAAAIAGALVFGGGGIAIGYAIAPGGSHAAPVRSGPFVNGNGRLGPLPGRRGNRYRGGLQPSPSTTPSATPSSGATS